jgi:hypothetical protein
MAAEVAVCVWYLVAVTFVLPALSFLPVFVSDSYQVLHFDMTPYILSQHIKETLIFNPLALELNPSAQRCLTRFFTGDFAS